jgi:hypothetical protein
MPMLTPFNNPASAGNLSVRFLHRILPEQGFYIAAVKLAKGKGFKSNLFTSTVEDLWTAIENADHDGFDAYHACASFKEPHNDPPNTPDGQKRFGRTKKNALGAKAFWLDIDVGPGKLYASQKETLDALAAFCRAFNLPPPIIVSSGSGLHVYWPLQRMLDPETWARHASGLKALCAEYGLHVDPARTADISSVLRTPGTHNRKGGAACVVECDHEFLEIEPYAIERFDILAAHADLHRPTKRGNVLPFPFDNVPKHLSGRSPRRRLAEAMRQIATHAPVSAAAIVDQCGQVRALRDKKGCLPEPLWYGALGVLAFCEDGEMLGHEWSKGDERYTYEETQEKLDRARQLTGATTCAHFHSLDSKMCEACQHWRKIKSPIVLGQRLAEPGATVAAVVAGGHSAALLAWEYTKGGALRAKSYANTHNAVVELGIRCRHDIFHDRKFVEGGGDAIEKLGPELSDPICRAVRQRIHERKGFDPSIQNTRDVLEHLCEANRFDPILDYFDSLQWDGQPRLDRWLVTYLEAQDTELNRMIRSPSPCRCGAPGSRDVSSTRSSCSKGWKGQTSRPRSRCWPGRKISLIKRF